MKPENTRRTFLKSALATVVTGVGLVGGLLKPAIAFAGWNQAALESGKVVDALEGAFGDLPVILSDQVVLQAPEVAENGASVPITIEADLPDVESIALLSEENPRPLAAVFHPRAGVRPKVLMRIRMARTGDAIAVVKSGEQLFMARRKVKVTLGGCG